MLSPLTERKKQDSVFVDQIQGETIYDLGVCRAVKRSYRQNRNFSLWALISGSKRKGVEESSMGQV